MSAEEKTKGAALVTGAGKRIGSVIARHLSKAGYAVALHCNQSRRDAEMLMGSLVAGGGRAAVVQADLADADQVRGLVHAAKAALGPLTLLVNNASIFEDDRAQTFEVGTLQRHFAVNLQAPLILAQEFDRELPADMRGAIVNIIDQRVLKLNPQFFSYMLSKSALWTATKTLAQALAPRIRVNGIGPGPTLANVHEGLDGFQSEASQTLLQRASSPEAIAEAVLYLASAEAVTGQMIAVDSGQHLVWQTPDIVSK
ncbi:MAG: SDR family oxidoreductase [Beijerinckiaceae bacterium]|nr:SDR family oxidoreductase [Beijerinckiaceae bacterium]